MPMDMRKDIVRKAGIAEPPTTSAEPPPLGPADKQVIKKL
jgi:hypothetical protein